MEASTYQMQAARTLLAAPDGDYSDQDIMLVWSAIGLSGEAGEVADLVKKGVFHRHGVDRDKLVKELGDVLWYVAGLCTTMGLNMSDVMAQNIDKLKVRYKDGYSSQASMERIDLSDYRLP